MTTEQIAATAIAAREEALIAGAPALDAAWIGIQTIDRLVCENTRRRLGLADDGPGCGR